MNDALSVHAQFQLCNDLICAFGQTPTVNWEYFIRKPETLGHKTSRQIFLSNKKDNKSEQFLSLLFKILREWIDSSLRHFSPTVSHNLSGQ